MIYKFPLFLILLSFIQLTLGQETPTIEKQYIKSIEKLAKNKKVQKAFEYIKEMDATTMKRHIELTEIEAPPLKKKTGSCVCRLF